MDSFRVICINDKFKPECIPSGCWIEKNKVYTVVEVKNLARQHMTLGYRLAEVSLPVDSPYQFFLSNRFRPFDEDAEAMLAVEELLKEVKEEAIA